MTKKIRLLVLESHYKINKNGERKTYDTHAVDFWRTLNPAKHLTGHSEFHVETRKDPIEGFKEKDWNEVTGNFDIIYSSYIDSPIGYVNIALWSKKNGTIRVTDVDDNLWEVPVHSTVHKYYHYGAEKLNSVSLALEDTPNLTTTSLFLKYKLVKYLRKKHEDIKVFPNFMDLELFNYKDLTPKKPDGKITIVFQGTNTHTRDLFESNFFGGLQRIMKEYDNVYFQTTGFFLPQFITEFGNKYKFKAGKMDFHQWVKLWGTIMSEGDIVVAPLEQTDFNRCKSGLKYLEYSAAKKAGVYEDIREYQELIDKTADNNEKRGFLASSVEEWYKALKTLIDNENLRRQIGENAYQYVKKNHTIQGNIEMYADYFKGLYEHRQKYHNLEDSGFVMPAVT